MLRVICANCGTNKYTQVLFNENIDKKKLNSKTFSARRIPDKMHYRFLKCNNCGLIFSSPVQNENTINNLYLQSDFNYKVEADFLKKTYFSYFKKFMSGKGNKNIKILEIGCGNGFFLEELIDNGYKNVFGIEPGTLSIEKARYDVIKRITKDVLKKNSFKKGSFDVICCFHTLDHIVNPNLFLKNVNNFLNKNGKIFFVVHDTDGLSVKLLGESSPIFDIEHIFLFNKQSLKKIFSSNGFKNLNVFKLKNAFPLSYWIHLFPISLSLKNIFFKISPKNIKSFSISLKAGNIGIVAVKS